MNKKWYVLYCKSGKDEFVEQNLSTNGLEVYRPKLKVKKQKTNKPIVRKNTSLFPRYMFVNVDNSRHALSDISYTRGVSGFVRFGDVYPNVKNEMIDDLKRCEQIQEEYSQFKKGDSVLINGGGFNNLDAIFLIDCGKSRVFVLLDLLGERRKIAVPYSFVSNL